MYRETSIASGTKIAIFAEGRLRLWEHLNITSEKRLSRMWTVTLQRLFWTRILCNGYTNNEQLNLDKRRVYHVQCSKKALPCSVENRQQKLTLRDECDKSLSGVEEGIKEVAHEVSFSAYATRARDARSLCHTCSVPVSSILKAWKLAIIVNFKGFEPVLALALITSTILR